MLLQGSPQSVAEFLVSLFEVVHGPFLDEQQSILEMSGDVLHQSLALFLRQDFLPEVPNLAEVVLLRRIVAINVRASVQSFSVLLPFGQWFCIDERIGQIVGHRTTISIVAIRSIPLGRTEDGAFGFIHRNIVEIRAKAG